MEQAEGARNDLGVEDSICLLTLAVVAVCFHRLPAYCTVGSMHSMSVIEVAEGLNERYGDTDTDLYVDATYLAHGLLRYGSVLKTKLCWELEPSKAADSFAQAVGSFALQRRGNRLKFPASNSYAPGSWAPPVVRAQVQKVARQLVDCKFGGRHALAAPSLAQLYSPKFINPLLQLAAREQQQLQQVGRVPHVHAVPSRTCCTLTRMLYPHAHAVPSRACCTLTRMLYPHAHAVPSRACCTLAHILYPRALAVPSRTCIPRNLRARQQDALQAGPGLREHPGGDECSRGPGGRRLAPAGGGGAAAGQPRGGGDELPEDQGV